MFVLASVVRGERGITFTVDGISRDGVEQPAGLTIEEYAALWRRLERDLHVRQMPLGRACTFNVRLEVRRQLREVA